MIHRFNHADLDPSLNALAEEILAAVKEVRKEVGVGLLEEAYRVCLLHELRLRGIDAKPRVRLPLVYKGEPMDKGYEADVIVADRIVLELKAVTDLHPSHEAQLLTYMRLSGCALGFLINFNAVPLGSGIVRRVMTPTK